MRHMHMGFISYRQREQITNSHFTFNEMVKQLFLCKGSVFIKEQEVV